MNKPRWINKEQALIIHQVMIDEFGGLQGVRDEGLLESALSKAVNLFEYEAIDIFDAAAAYAEGIVRNHPFADGNKRTALSVAGIFLEKNGYSLDTANHADIMVQLAEGIVTRAVLRDYFIKHTMKNM